MATIKIKFRPSSKAGREGRLYYQVIHNRIVRQIKTTYQLFPSEWDSEQARVTDIYADDKRRRYLSSVEREIEGDLMKLRRIISRFEEHAYPFSVYDILETYHSPWEAKGYFEFAYHLVKTMKEAGKVVTYENFTNALKRFRCF